MRRTACTALGLAALAAGAPAASGDGGPSTTQLAVGAGAVWATTDLGTVLILPRASRRAVAPGYVDGLFADGTVVAGGRAWTLGGGSLWSTGSSGPPLRVGEPPASLAAGAGRVYVIDQGGGARISQISTSTGRSAGRSFLPGSRLWSGRLAHGSLWVGQLASQTPRQRREGGHTGPGRILRLDPVTGDLRARIEVGPTPFEIVAARGAVWVVDPSDRTLRRIDARTSRVTATHRVSGGATAVAAIGGRLWVNAPGGVARIDPETGRVVGRTAIAGGVIDLEAGLGSVWAGSGCGGRVFRLSRRTGRVIERFAVPTARQGGCPTR
jgi:DNA-binding beta-propeller fold protein YncE